MKHLATGNVSSAFRTAHPFPSFEVRHGKDYHKGRSVTTARKMAMNPHPHPHTSDDKGHGGPQYSILRFKGTPSCGKATYMAVGRGTVKQSRPLRSLRLHFCPQRSGGHSAVRGDPCGRDGSLRDTTRSYSLSFHPQNQRDMLKRAMLLATNTHDQHLTVQALALIRSRERSPLKIVVA